MMTLTPTESQQESGSGETKTEVGSLKKGNDGVRENIEKAGMAEMVGEDLGAATETPLRKTRRLQA